MFKTEVIHSSAQFSNAAAYICDECRPHTASLRRRVMPPCNHKVLAKNFLFFFSFLGESLRCIS